jgi:hypothetical protein
MKKQLCCVTPTRHARVGWISFQPGDHISFGLTQKTFLMSGHPAPITGLHFTYHPAIWFHLVGGRPRRRFFEGIMDINIMLQQESEVTWTRAVSGPISALPIGGLRSTGVDLNEWILQSDTDRASVFMALSFIRPEACIAQTNEREWRVHWGAVGLRLVMGLCPPQRPELSWVHHH